MPAVDISRTVTDFSSDEGSVTADVTYMIFGVSFGWESGKEMKKLKTMDDKLDRIENKLDKLGDEKKE